ncbi:Variant surface glycoprotein, partial [Trypanosoma congolense IL3000]
MERVYISLWAFGLLASQAVEAAGDGKNIPQMIVLCNIYKQGVSMKQLSNVTPGPEEPKILSELEKMNMSTLDEAAWGLLRTEEYNEADWKAKKEEFSKKTVSIDRGELSFKRLHIKETAKLANRKINRARLAAIGLKSLLDQEREAVNRNIVEAQRYMNEALYGDGKLAEDDDTFADKRADGCGSHDTAATPGKDSGKSLLNDLVCLCAQGGGDRNGSQGSQPDGLACAGKISAITPSWYSSSVSKQKARAAWTQGIKPLCEKLKTVPATAALLRKNLDRYLAFVSGAAQQLASGGFVVGLSQSNNGICAAGHADAACVAYKAKQDGIEPEIPWVQKAELAVDKLERVEAGRQKLEKLDEQLRVVNRQAWNIYEDLENDETT